MGEATTSVRRDDVRPFRRNPWQIPPRPTPSTTRHLSKCATRGRHTGSPCSAAAAAVPAAAAAASRADPASAAAAAGSWARCAPPPGPVRHAPDGPRPRAGPEPAAVLGGGGRWRSVGEGEALRARPRDPLYGPAAPRQHFDVPPVGADCAQPLPQPGEAATVPEQHGGTAPPHGPAPDRLRTGPSGPHGVACSDPLQLTCPEDQPLVRRRAHRQKSLLLGQLVETGAGVVGVQVDH